MTLTFKSNNSNMKKKQLMIKMKKQMQKQKKWKKLFSDQTQNVCIMLHREIT